MAGNQKPKIYYCLFLLLLVSCSPKVVHFTNSKVNFGQFESYAIVNFKAPNAEISQEGIALLTSIEKNIKAQMERRSYEFQTNEPDIVVRYELISNQVTQIDQNPYSFYSPFRGVSYRTFLESALLIEIFDTSNKKLIWQASMDLNRYTRRKNKEEVIKDAVSRLFDTYLYRSGSNQPDESLKESK